MRKAILKNKVTGVEIEVYATTEHPDSSYGKAVWVDKNNVAYLQVDYPFENPFYEVNEMTMEKLTIYKAQELFDKVIEWTAPSAEGNMPYYGKAIITDIKANNRPIVATILEGDNLNFAICEDDVNIDFSDVGRGITFRVLEK